jgi:hypothetical protein
LKELAWSCLLKVKYLLDNDLSFIQDIGKTLQIYSILREHKAKWRLSIYYLRKSVS